MTLALFFRSAGSRGEEKEKMVDALIMLMGLAAYFMLNDFMQGRKLQFVDLLPLSWSLERKKSYECFEVGQLGNARGVLQHISHTIFLATAIML